MVVAIAVLQFAEPARRPDELKDVVRVLVEFDDEIPGHAVRDAHHSFGVRVRDVTLEPTGYIRLVGSKDVAIGCLEPGSEVLQRSVEIDDDARLRRLAVAIDPVHVADVQGEVVTPHSQHNLGSRGRRT